jgi:hypothetical protein
MADNVQLEILARGAATWNQWRLENPDVAIDLEAADLKQMNLENVNLATTDLKKANLAFADFNRANLAFADLESAIFSYANFEGANFTGANLENAYMEDANLRGANFSGANFRNANLSSVVFDQKIMWPLIRASRFNYFLSGGFLQTAAAHWCAGPDGRWHLRCCLRLSSGFWGLRHLMPGIWNLIF